MDIDGKNLKNVALIGYFEYKEIAPDRFYSDEVKELLNIQDSTDGEDITSYDKNLEDELQNNEEGEYVHNNSLRWTINPKWAGESVIAFASNRDVFPTGYASSIWTMNIETGEVIKRIDAIVPNDELNVFYADDESIVAWGGISNNLYRYQFKDDKIDTYKINGVPFSVSNNGNLVLFKQLNETATQLTDI